MYIFIHILSTYVQVSYVDIHILVPTSARRANVVRGEKKEPRLEQVDEPVGEQRQRLTSEKVRTGQAFKPQGSRFVSAA